MLPLATFIVALATFIAAFATLYVMLSKPLVKVSFWDGKAPSRETTLPFGQETNLSFLFQNEGERLWRLKLQERALLKPAATMLTAFIYFPDNFELKEVWRYETEEKISGFFKASPSGRFENRKYVAVPSVYKEVRPPAISILSHGEDVICVVKVMTPVHPTSDKIFVQMVSREGDLGVHELRVKFQ